MLPCYHGQEAAASVEFDVFQDAINCVFLYTVEECWVRYRFSKDPVRGSKRAAMNVVCSRSPTVSPEILTVRPHNSQRCEHDGPCAKRCAFSLTLTSRLNMIAFGFTPGINFSVGSVA